MRELDLTRYGRIVVLTGAGVSVASGIRPFRGLDGVWNEISADRLNATTAQQDPAFIWQVLGPLRAVAEAAAPNPVHHSLAAIGQQLRANQKLTLITQNIDGLHQRAGSKNVLELHGSILQTRCSNPACDLTPFADNETYAEQLPRCPQCKSHLLPNVVLFDEQIPPYVDWQSKRALRDVDLFIAIGTSGTVAPAANYVRSAEYVGARTLLINLEPQLDPSPYFHEKIYGPAEELVPQLLGA